MIMKKPLWFKAKNYGWGWYPSTWQGWVILIAYLIFLLYRGKETSMMFDTATSFAFRYSFETIFATVLLIVICFLTGEKSEWRWGGKK